MFAAIRILSAAGAMAGILAPPAPSRSARPPYLPQWQLRKVASLTTGLPPMVGFLTAQLDGVGPQELVSFEMETISDRDPSQVEVFRFVGDRFQVIYKGRVSAAPQALGDLDGDGRDELYAINARNELVTLRLQRNSLHAVRAERIGDWKIASLVVSDARRPGRPELVLAVNSTGRFDSDDEAQGDRLLGYARTRGKWVNTWQRCVELQSFRVELLAGDYHPTPGPELVVMHHPSEVDEMPYEVLSWHSGRCRRVAQQASGPWPPDGARRWIEPLKLRGGRHAIVSHTLFLQPREPFDVSERGEILVWRRSTTPAAFTLPGEPVAVGTYRGKEQLGILIKDSDDRFTLYDVPAFRPGSPSSSK